MKTFDYSSIPEELKTFNNWVLFKDKIPYSAKYNGRAKANDPETWTSFDKALTVYDESQCFIFSNEPYDGIGFVVSKDTGVIFIDIDHCIDESEGLDDRAYDILDKFSGLKGELYAYVEVSQSGTGLHILTLGTIPRSFKNSKNGVEMYSDKRYCAMTGDTCATDYLYYNGIMIPNQDAIDYVFEKYKTPEKVVSDRPLSVDSVLDISDTHIIEKAKDNPKTGHTFSLLWEGNYSSLYESHSEADLVLCQILAFWTDRDFRRIDNIFRSSGLYREKWERREDYRSRTINTAISNCRLSLSEYVNQKQREEVARREKRFLSE